MEVELGGYALPVILSIILGLIYKFTGVIPDKWKALVSVICGMALGNLSLAYKGLDWTIVNIVDYNLYGLMLGASAIGLYELQRTATRPRG